MVNRHKKDQRKKDLFKSSSSRIVNVQLEPLILSCSQAVESQFTKSFYSCFYSQI